jgi:hypothetical protein
MFIRICNFIHKFFRDSLCRTRKCSTVLDADKTVFCIVQSCLLMVHVTRRCGPGWTQEDRDCQQSPHCVYPMSALNLFATDSNCRVIVHCATGPLTSVVAGQIAILACPCHIKPYRSWQDSNLQSSDS